MSEGETNVAGQEASVPVTEAPALDAKKLESELALAKQELDKWQKEAKAHQSNFSKTDAELRKIKAEKARMEALENKIDVVASALTELIDKDSEPNERKSIPYKQKLEEVNQAKVKQTVQAQNEEMTLYANQIAELTKKANIDADSDDLLKAKNLWLMGKMQESLEEVRRIVEQKTVAQPKVDKVSELEKQLKEAQEEIKKFKGGGLNTEIPVVAGKTQSFKDIENRYARGEISSQEYKKARKENGL